MKTDSERGRYASPDGSATWEYIGVISCASLIFCTGCMGGWTSPTLGKLMEPGSPISLTSSDASTLSAIGTLGHAVAPAFTIIMADKLGRKISLMISGIPAIISWTTIAMSKHMVFLFGARFIAGLSFGLIISITPMYLGEIASAKLRGAIGTVCSIMSNAGWLFMFAIVPYLSVTTTACICASVAALSAMGAWFITESPYFLAMVGKTDEAESALEKLRGKPDAGEELELIKAAVHRKGNDAREESKVRSVDEVRAAPEIPSAMKQLFNVPGNRKALGINFLFTIALQLGSYISIMTYGDIIIKKMNTGVRAQVCTMVIAAIQLVCNILVAFVIDRVGRRPLICVSGLVSGFCVLVVAGYFYLIEYTKVDVTPWGLFALCAIFLNIIALNVGLMPLQTVIRSEILDTEVKALATCFIGVGGGIIATFGVKYYLMVAETWGYGHCVPFLVFAANTWFCTLLILKSLPETKGKTLLDIQRDLNA